MAGERILVCDDGKETRDFIVDYVLKPNNFETLQARNGVEALEVMREHHPDLVLLDLQMPRMDGMQVLDAMKQETIDIPVVLMTFHGSEEIAIEVYRKGVRDYVKKPFSVEEMLWAIERTLTEVRLRKEKEALTERLISANADMNQRLRELNTLYNIGKSVTSLVGLDELFPRILRAAIEVTGSETGNLYLLQGEQLVCRASKTTADGQILPLNQAVNDPFAWRAIQIGQPLVLGPNEMQQHRRQNPNIPMSILVTPLMMGERVVGALSVSNLSSDTRTFRKQDGVMLSALSDYAAIAIENSTNFTELAMLKEREVNRIRHALKRFIAPAMLDMMLAGGTSELPAPGRAEISVVLVTLRGYESLVARTNPDQLTNMLNQYLDLAVEVLSHYGGTVEKYLGDGAIAYFNAPESNQNHVMQAIEAAIALQQSTGERSEGFNFSVAIHVGSAVVGNIGAVRGIGFSAVGDAIRMAQRIQDKTQPGQILVSEDLISKVQQEVVRATYLGQLSLPDRQQRLNVYEIQGLA